MDYTGAVEFFLLGRHLSVKMQLTGETMAAHINARVLVKRQWAALDHVESTIASACRKQLALPSVSDEVSSVKINCWIGYILIWSKIFNCIFCFAVIPLQMLGQALTALLVLEDQTMKLALDEYLSGRTVSFPILSQLFVVL